MRFGIVGGQDGAGDAGTQVDLAAQNLLNGMNQFSGNLALQDVALDASTEGGGNVLGFIVLGQENGFDLGTTFGEFAGRFHAVERGHADIHYYNVGRKRFGVLDSFASVGSFRDYLQTFALEQGLDALPN